MVYTINFDGNVTVGADTYAQIASVYPEDESLVPAAPSGQSRYEDNASKLISVTGNANIGWWVNISTNVAVQSIDRSSELAVQRAEIYSILLDDLTTLDTGRLAAKSGAVEAASLRVRSLGAYVSVNTDDDILDALKAEARDDLNEFALAANTESTGNSSWLVALRAPGLFLYSRPDPFVIGGTALPGADTSTGLVHPTQAQLDAFDVRRALS